VSLEEKLDRVVSRHDELRDAVASHDNPGSEDYAIMLKELSELAPVVASIDRYRKAASELHDLAELMEDPATEPEMRGLAEAEYHELKERLPALERELRLLLLPKDEADERNAILEVRAGTGGEEAALFAAELYRMYQRFAELRGWRFEPLQVNETGLGGFKEASVSIGGRGVFANLKFESGVHRVQRVPVTESGGRIHTSAATVAVLPEAEEVDVQIDDKDLRIDVYRSSGPGGQSVNTTDSAVRITHLPTGIVVTQQDEKSQHKNKAKAMKVLRARLYDLERERRAVERAEDRRSQVGSGDRSERVRTYNFPQGRVTDHRINLTLYKLERVLEGEALGELVEAEAANDHDHRRRGVGRGRGRAARRRRRSAAPRRPAAARPRPRHRPRGPDRRAGPAPRSGRPGAVSRPHRAPGTARVGGPAHRRARVLEPAVPSHPRHPGAAAR
jgi:peptide chain release factor 1